MDWVLGGLVISAFAIGVLGVAELVVFFVLGAAHTAFIVLALMQAGLATGLAICLVISFVYVLTINR